jgi:DNA topoisomerase-1
VYLTAPATDIQGNRKENSAMAKYLVIVESPAKVKTIKKFLGKNYEVVASNGHIRDLPKSRLGIDVEHDYEPKYITIRGKGDILSMLRKEVKKADKIYLATDPDREGEAISWHLTQAIHMEDKQVYRISFNEITQNAVKASLKNPREIDMGLVDAQQARRALDRMVGYRISPLLWAKVKRGLSAGRVQSVALRIVCDREEEINAFIPEEYWSLDATLRIEGEKKPVVARLSGKGNDKIAIASKEEMDDVLAQLKGNDFVVLDVKRSERAKKAPLPFTTSTLQQEASKALNFPISKTMRIAQQLYEGVDIKGQGTIGLITYLRTDSVRISDEAEDAAAGFIMQAYGEPYLSAGRAGRKSNVKIQDAHEAIRPSDINRVPSEIKDSLSRDQFRLYQLIWKRFAASQMADARYETTTVSIGAGDYRFKVSTSKLAFDGFRSVYVEADDEKEDSNVLLGSIDEHTTLSLAELEPKQHFTQPPAHYTEASLVKTLEELGIGRPSTYSPTITTILARRYIIKENKNLYVTEIGEVVNSIMKESFPTIVDEHFTANMESLLDAVAEGKVGWKTVIANFYPDLDAAVIAAEKDLEKVTIADEVSEEVCEVCGRNMVIKYGPHGKFLACPGFPECRNTKPYFEKIGVSCPKCGKDIVLKKTRKGRKYYGCIDNPECDFMSWGRPVAEKCPRCGGCMIVKGNKYVCADEQCGFIMDPPAQKEN